MRKSFVYSTENNNSYLYDTQHLYAVLIHPELDKVHKKAIDADPYYLKKYAYLKEYGFWGKSKSADFETTLDESRVKRNIIQTRQIVFETTDYCNLSCPYCSLGELYNIGKKDRKNINIRYAVNFLKYMFDLKPEKTKLKIGFFGGEPLVNVNFIKKIVGVAKQLNAEKELELEFNMTTNGTLIQKHIQFLVKNNFELLISLDGNEEGQSYRTFAKNNKNSFWKVIENADMIQRDYPEYFADKVNFNAVLHNRNSVKGIYGFIYNRYHKIPRISQMNTGNINPDKKDIFESMFHSKRKSEEEYQDERSGLSVMTHNLLTLYDELKNFLNNHSINFYISNILYLLYEQVKPLPTGTCFPFSKKMFLNTNHNLLPCEKVCYEYSLGKVDRTVTIDIPEIVRKYNFYYDHIKKYCSDCYSSRGACSVCLLTIENLDEMDTDKFTCPGFQNQESYKNKLSYIISFLEKYPSDFFQIIDNAMTE
jgi:uncharacterized protein